MAAAGTVTVDSYYDDDDGDDEDDDGSGGSKSDNVMQWRRLSDGGDGGDGERDSDGGKS